METYEISAVAHESTDEYDVTLRGPGLDPHGRHYIFRYPDRYQNFVDTVNLAYQQGLADGRRQGRHDAHGSHVMVSGSTPDRLYARPERWWERVLRRLKS